MTLRIRTLHLRTLQRGLAAGSLSVLACGAPQGEPVASPRPALTATPSAPSERATPLAPVRLAEPVSGADPEARVTAALERLERLEVLELGAIAETRTVHTWVPYGGLWIDREDALSPEEQASRLEALAELAEGAVLDAKGIATGFWDEAGRPSLCTALDADDGAYCLTRDLHQANLDALNALDVVTVVDIVRSAPLGHAACYSSWETVREDDCERALKLEAIVDAVGAREEP